MAKILAKMAGLSDDTADKAIAKYEQKTGFTSQDVRLLAENKHMLRRKISQLGLDPDDTTDAELYHALLNKFASDSQNLDRALGVDTHTSLSEKIDKAIQLAGYCARCEDMWLLKPTAAKALLKKYPPKRLAKALRYRSVDSLVKREDVGEIYLAAAILEPLSWKNALTREISKLTAAEYEIRPLKIIKIDGQRWANESIKNGLLTDNNLGVVALWPAAELRDASVAVLTLMMLGGLRSLNPAGYSESLHELSPALRWWADGAYLLSDGETPVSFNIKDVSLNHWQGNDISRAHSGHGAGEIWDELARRYRDLGRSLARGMGDLEVDLIRQKLPSGDDLAEDIAAAE